MVAVLGAKDYFGVLDDVVQYLGNAVSLTQDATTVA